MSILLLIDGYNLIAPMAAPSQRRSIRAELTREGSKPWLLTEREKLLARLAEHLDEPVRTRTCVVFDAKNAPAGQPSSLTHAGIEVRFAVDHPEADDLLEELIRRHHHPKQLTVVSSDHRIQAAAKRKRASFIDSEPWYDALEEGVVLLGWTPSKRREKPPTDRSDAKAIEPPSLPDLDISDEDLQGWIDGSPFRFDS
ncbi:NYN domain-containing protein [Neorhodopirellula pilleata]|uniref:YacP-like NYN domain protein n=1 Tax=Neorhodopirellula pilleata TaxID=2714738 RepID=A0A5C6AFJ4_9BACT|nr:NYN domain-containing protein [Neorhodopirellula pilleata]TWT98802.1 YacP-like NYN domain protein [Neorhodopirellula pilleata]